MQSRSLSQLKCCCKSTTTTTRTISKRTASTSTTTIPTSTPILLASSLLSRPPLILPPLNPLEKSYYIYQQKIARSLSKPVSTSSEWFFKSGTTAQKSFLNFDKAYEKEDGTEVQNREFEVVLAGTEEGNSLVGSGLVVGEEGAKVASVEGSKSLQRKADRTLYLLVKSTGKMIWTFPQGPLTTGESLLDAAQRQLHEKIGEDVDVWPIGRVPAGSFSSQAKGKTPSTSTFFLPMRIVRGQASKSAVDQSKTEFAWLTKEEIKEKVEGDYWEAIEPMLSEM